MPLDIAVILIIDTDIIEKILPKNSSFILFWRIDTLAIIKNGSIQHNAVIPIAGDQITNDIAVAFTTPYQSAEDIKINHGSAVSFMASINEIIEIPLVSGMEPKKVTTQALSQVIQPRVSELFELRVHLLANWERLMSSRASGLSS